MYTFFCYAAAWLVSSYYSLQIIFTIFELKCASDQNNITMAYSYYQYKHTQFRFSFQQEKSVQVQYISANYIEGDMHSDQNS